MATAVIDLSALETNLSAIRSLLTESTQVLGAVKANAYGHGAIHVTRALESAGVRWFAVATPGELLELRNAGVNADLLLLTPPLERIDELVRAGTVFTLADQATLERLQSWKVPKGTRVHLKVDTGLGRLGVLPEEAAGLAVAAERAGYAVEGVFTHLAAAEDDPALTRLQGERFQRALQLLKQAGIEPALRHASNSAGILNHPELHLDMVRPGLLLYGYSPLPHGSAQPLEGHLRQVMTLLAPITSVKRISPGQGVSYNHLWRAEQETTILSVRCGYADGYRRLLSDRAWATLHGVRLEQRGRVAMDQLMLDAGELDAQPGELVTLLGGTGPGADELGELAATNAYDILSSFTRRISRQYVRHAG